jgi:hypothetical protein
MPRPVKRRHSIIRDIWGDRWSIAERRPTRYGFAVYMGWPYIPDGPQKGGRAAVIVTAPLAAHLRKHVQRPHFLPLPVGRKTLRRVRQLVGVDHRVWTDTWITWWVDRIDDLGKLSVVKFAQRHQGTAWTRQGTLGPTIVFKMRVALLGP